MGGSHGYTLNFRAGTAGSGNLLTLSNISRIPTEKRHAAGKICPSRDHEPFSSLYPRDPHSSPCTGPPASYRSRRFPYAGGLQIGVISPFW